MFQVYQSLNLLSLSFLVNVSFTSARLGIKIINQNQNGKQSLPSDGRYLVQMIFFNVIEFKMVFKRKVGGFHK